MFNDTCSFNKVIKVLIIGDNGYKEMLDFLSKNKRISLCGCVQSGLDLELELKIYKPNVVIVDVNAVDNKGDNILKKLKNIADDKPKIIALSSSNNINELEESFKNGVNYYIRRPIILSLLEDAIISVCGGNCKSGFDIGKIKKFIRLIGVPTNILGYIYICEALYYMLENPRIMFLNEVYKLIAKDNITSSESVEVSIRNAIKKTVKLNNMEFEKIFGSNIKSLSNSQFLTIIKEILFEKNF